MIVKYELNEEDLMRILKEKFGKDIDVRIHATEVRDYSRGTDTPTGIYSLKATITIDKDTP